MRSLIVTTLFSCLLRIVVLWYPRLIQVFSLIADKARWRTGRFLFIPQNEGTDCNNGCTKNQEYHRDVQTTSFERCNFQA